MRPTGRSLIRDIFKTRTGDGPGRRAGSPGPDRRISSLNDTRNTAARMSRCMTGAPDGARKGKRDVAQKNIRNPYSYYKRLTKANRSRVKWKFRNLTSPQREDTDQLDPPIEAGSRSLWVRRLRNRVSLGGGRCLKVRPLPKKRPIVRPPRRRWEKRLSIRNRRARTGSGPAESADCARRAPPRRQNARLAGVADREARFGGSAAFPICRTEEPPHFIGFRKPDAWIPAKTHLRDPATDLIKLTIARKRR